MLALNFHLLVSIFTCIPTHPPGGSSKQLTHGLQHRSHGMTPSRCPNCGFASLFLDPFFSRMRVGVWDTSTFSCKSISVKQGDGTWRANPPFSGNGPNGQALPHCGTFSSLRGAFSVLPVAELLVVDARTSAACPTQLSTKSTSQERKTNKHVQDYNTALGRLDSELLKSGGP